MLDECVDCSGDTYGTCSMCGQPLCHECNTTGDDACMACNMLVNQYGGQAKRMAAVEIALRKAVQATTEGETRLVEAERSRQAGYHADAARLYAAAGRRAREAAEYIRQAQEQLALVRQSVTPFTGVRCDVVG